MFCAPMYTGHKNCATEDWVRCYYKPWVYGYASNVPVSEEGFVCVNHNYTQCLPLKFFHVATNKIKSYNLFIL